MFYAVCVLCWLMHGHLNSEQSDQIGRFIGLSATFQSLWQQEFYPNFQHSQAIFVKMSKSLIYLVKSFLGNSYRHLATFYWSHWLVILNHFKIPTPTLFPMLVGPPYRQQEASVTWSFSCNRKPKISLVSFNLFVHILIPFVVKRFCLHLGLKAPSSP